MRLVSASIRPHEGQGLELEGVQLGTPTLIVGPNGAGKSRLLEALDAFLGPSFAERRLSTSLEAVVRRRASEQAVSELQAHFCFELDQVDMPDSWDSEFLGAHIFSPYYELQPRAREAAFELSLQFVEAQLTETFETLGQDLPEEVIEDYFKLLLEVLRAIRYVEVGVGFYESWNPSIPLVHWPAFKVTDLSQEAMDIAARLAPLRTSQEDLAHGIERFPFIQFLLEDVARGTLSSDPFNPGIPECDSCDFPNIDLIRVGPESPALDPLLRQLSATILDLEGLLRAGVADGEDAASIRAFGDSEATGRLRSKLGEWEARLARRLMENMPPFMPSDPYLAVHLGLESLGRNELRLSAALEPDPHLAYGAGHLKWVAYALAKTTADVRRSRTSTLAGDVTRGESEAVTKANRPLMVLLDEPESHLHWQLQQAVAEWTANESLKPNRTIIAATHSPVFMGMKARGKSFIPMEAGRAMPDPKHLESLVYLAGADKTVLHMLVRGYLLVEGYHEMQIFRACFGAELREQDLHLQQLFGSYGARGSSHSLKDLGRPIVAILDRVSREAIEGTKKSGLTHEEKTALDLLKYKSARVVHFEVHDVIQALPEALLEEAMGRLFPQRARRSWSWREVVSAHEAERKRKDGSESYLDFKFAFLSQAGLFDSRPGEDAKAKNSRAVNRIVSAAAEILGRSTPPPLLRDVFLRALDAFDPWPDPNEVRRA